MALLQIETNLYSLGSKLTDLEFSFAIRNQPPSPTEHCALHMLKTPHRLIHCFVGSLHLARSIPERGPNCWLQVTISPLIANAMAEA